MERGLIRTGRGPDSADGEEVGDATRRLQRFRRHGKRRAVDQHVRRRVVHDEGEFGNGESPVEKDGNGSEPAAGELHVEELDAVRGQQRDPVAAPDADGAKV